MKRVLGTTFVFGIALMGTLIAQAGSKPAGQGSMANQGSMAKTSIVTEADYATAMKEIGSTNGMLGKAIQSGAAADAAKASARLETLFNDVHGYWVAKKVEDASTASANAVAASQAISKAVAGNDMTAAAEARTKLGATCMACHTAHREKTDAGFVIK